MPDPVFDADTYAKFDELIRVARRAARRAQQESREKGVPNVYSINGLIYYELPNGELTRVDPYKPPEGDAAVGDPPAEPAAEEAGGI